MMNAAVRDREEQIRRDVELAFKAHDDAVAGTRRGRSGVSQVLLTGDFPETRLVVRGKSLSGEPIETISPIWDFESYFDVGDERADAGAVSLFVLDYVLG